jgi:hypothetical protein
LLDDELMNDTRAAHRSFSWSSIAAIIVEAVAGCGFVIAVYGLVVAGGTALLPHPSENGILVLWVAAAAIAGSGMTVVITGAGRLIRKVLPAADPHLALMSLVSGAAAAGPIEDVLPRLAELLAEGAGARSAAVWLAVPSGLRRASYWPDGDGQDQPDRVAGQAELRSLTGVDHVAPVRHAGQVFGALTLRAKPGRFLALPDVRLAADMANRAGLLLRNAELTERRREQVRLETAQEGELARSRRRMVVARVTAREQLSAEIQARVCAPLESCAARVALLSLDEPAGESLAAGLAEMTGELDTAIADFRAIVHGVYPPVLTDHGLRAAMESLLTDIDPQAALVTHRIPRLAARVEAGTYFCAAALLRGWNGTGAQRPLRVLLGVEPRRIHVTFADSVPETSGRPALPVSPQVLEAVQDRVAALGGRMESASDESGRRLTIEVPLTPADLVTRGNGETSG